MNLFGLPAVSSRPYLPDPADGGPASLEPAPSRRPPAAVIQGRGRDAVHPAREEPGTPLPNEVGDDPTTPGDPVAQSPSVFATSRSRLARAGTDATFFSAYLRAGSGPELHETPEGDPTPAEATSCCAIL